MKNPAKRLFFTILTAVVFLVFYTIIMYFVGGRHTEDLIVKHNQRKTESVRSILNQLEETENEIGIDFYDSLNADVRLETISLAARVIEGEYRGTRLWEDSMVVRIVNGSADVPKEAEGMFPGLSAETVGNEYSQTLCVKQTGEGAPQEVFLTSGSIADGWYYVRWTPAAEYADYVSSHSSKLLLLDQIADKYVGEMFMVAAGGENAAAESVEKGTVLYGTAGMKNFAAISDLGIPREDLEKSYFTLSIEGQDTYICTPAVLKSGHYIVCCYSVSEAKAAFKGDVITQALFAFMLLIGLIVWCYSVAWMVVTKELKEDQIIKYAPAAVKRRTISLGGLSVILMFAVAFLTMTMQYVYEEDKTAIAMIGMLGSQIDEDRQSAADTAEADTLRYEVYGKKISEILTENPEYLDKDSLARMNRAIAADYLIVFDENGEEIGCSEDYTGFALGTAEKDASTDFRRLLKGISSVIHEPEEDFITGEKRRMIGVRYDLPDKEGKYGAILIALPVSDGEGASDPEAVKREVYRMMASEEEMILEIDPGTGMIESCSREEYAGANSGTLGIGKENLSDGNMNFFRVGRRWYFGISRMIGGKLFYYLTDNTDMFVIGIMFSLLTTVLFMFGYWVTARCALNDYTRENYEKYAPLFREVSQKQREMLDKEAKPVTYSIQEWADLPPEKKTKGVLQAEMGLFMAILLLFAVLDTPMAGYSPLNFVIEGNWTKGINIFGIVAAIMVFSIEYLVFLIIKVLFLLLYGILDSRGETASRLLRSLINYLLIIVAVCLALNFLGVDTATLLASLGLLSLAVSLGAKDMVADILSGIAIVFEGTFRVGDFVEIGGFRGKVVELGVRSTKLLGNNNEVKTISNHDINNVINLSERTSFCTVDIKVKPGDSLGKIEEMLERELPAMKEQISNLVSGPKYAGVISIENESMTLRIIAEAKVEDIPSVKMELNRAVQSLYERGLL